MIFSLIVDGLAVGSVYALVAVGLVMLVKSTGALNFAHGDFMMISTFVAYSILVDLKLSIWFALLGSLLFAAVLGIIAERIVIRNVDERTDVRDHHGDPRHGIYPSGDRKKSSGRTTYSSFRSSSPEILSG